MESILKRKGTGVNRRASITQLFNLQKPTLSLFQDQPTRYYDFVDTPVNHRRSSPFIDHQNISSQLESDIRYACSLLVYRIERGVPSPPANQPSKPSTGKGNEKTEHSSAARETVKPQIDSKYISPKVGAEMAAMKDKHDSGVGLTQQPSRQTMRVLQSSHSDEQFDSDDRAPGSLLSQIRSNTSASDTSYAEDSNSQPPIESSRQDEKQSMMGNIMGDVQMKDQDTVSFLAGASKSSSTADGASDDVEVFLSPDGVFESSGVPSFTSPLTSLSSNSASFGVSSNFTSNRQSQINDKSRFFGDRPVTMASVELSQSNEDGHQPGVIIDSNGLTHILTVEEEAQRKLDLQQAVMAKMSAGAVGPNSNAAPESPQQASTHTIPPPTLQSIPSRLQNSCSFRSKTSTWETLSSPKKPSIFQKIAGFFRKRRAPEQAY